MSADIVAELGGALTLGEPDRLNHFLFTSFASFLDCFPFDFQDIASST